MEYVIWIIILVVAILAAGYMNSGRSHLTGPPIYYYEDDKDANELPPNRNRVQ